MCDLLDLIVSKVLEIILILGFIETAILFLYALRWYFFTAVTVTSHRRAGSVPGKNPDNSFVSVLLPVYNESNVIDRLLRACTSFNCPPYEVVVVDDSNDGETQKKLDQWRGHPQVKVFHRDSRDGWKGGALNFGIDHVNPKTTHFLIFDADFVPSKDIVDRFLTRFNGDDVVAVQGYQRHDLNAGENWITKGVRVWHSLYNMIELNGLSKLGIYSPITGSVYMVKADVLRKIRYRPVMTEDSDLTVRLYQNGYKVLYDPTLAASAECPSTFRRLLRQQMRWAEGHTRTFRKHFFKMMRSKFLSLADKINFFFIGYSFLNSILVAALMVAWIITSLFPQELLPLPIVHVGLLLFLVSVPSALLASIAALHIEGTPQDYKKIGNAWLLNLILTPAVAFASLKGLFTNKDYFHRTFKTGKIVSKPYGKNN